MSGTHNIHVFHCETLIQNLEDKNNMEKYFFWPSRKSFACILGQYRSRSDYSSHINVSFDFKQHIFLSEHFASIGDEI